MRKTGPTPVSKALVRLKQLRLRVQKMAVLAFLLVLPAVALWQYWPVLDAGGFIGLWYDNLQRWLISLGWWGPVGLALIYPLLGMLALPTGVLNILGGVLFGFQTGLAAVLAGNFLAANTNYFLSRSLFRNRVLAYVERKASNAAILQACREQGWWLVFLLRVSPVMPFNVVSYVVAASGVRWTVFISASMAGLVVIEPVLIYAAASGAAALHTGAPIATGAVGWVIASI